MELPRDPTVIPQARRYEQTFPAIQGRAFRENDQISINIPQIDKTYLTKNTKLYFTFTLEYYESRNGTLSNIASEIDSKGGNSAGFWGLTTDTTRVMSRVYQKPVPTFDINGAHGLIQRLQVFSYLNNTLLEDIPSYDILTAQFADVWFQNNNTDIDRPMESVSTPFAGNPYNDNSVKVPPIGVRQILRQQPCANIYPPTSSIYTSPWNVTLVSATSVTANLTTVTVNCSLDLVSFLGLFSDKFVPLHNGFKIVLTLNKLTSCIKFNTAFGNNLCVYNNPAVENVGVYLDPYISNGYITNVYLKSELLEVSPELDEKVDKMVYAKSWKYQKDFFPYRDFSNKGTVVADHDREPFIKQITPNLKSVTAVFVGQRPIYQNPNFMMGKQELGYRLRNYTKGGNLFYNKTKVCSITSTQEAWEAYCALQPNPCVLYSDFNLDEPDINGTNGNQLVIPSSSLHTQLVFETLGLPGINSNPFFPYLYYFACVKQLASGDVGSTSFPPNMPTLTTKTQYRLSTFSQGKYLLCFNTRIPGATENSVAGIDTSKAILEYELTPENDVCQKVIIDVFVEHDAFIHVEPGKSTSVTF